MSRSQIFLRRQRYNPLHHLQTIPDFTDIHHVPFVVVFCLFIWLCVHLLYYYFFFPTMKSPDLCSCSSYGSHFINLVNHLLFCSGLFQF